MFIYYRYKLPCRCYSVAAIIIVTMNHNSLGSLIHGYMVSITLYKLNYNLEEASSTLMHVLWTRTITHMESTHVQSFSIRSGTTADQSTDSKSAQPLVDETKAQKIQTSTCLTSRSHSNQNWEQPVISVMAKLEEDSRGCFSELRHSCGVGTLCTANNLLCPSISTGEIHQWNLHNIL